MVIPTDLHRDAEKFYNYLLALEKAADELTRHQVIDFTSVDGLLKQLLVYLCKAFTAETAFTAALKYDGPKPFLEIIEVYLQLDPARTSIDFVAWLDKLVETRKTQVLGGIGLPAGTYIHGLEAFQAQSAILLYRNIAGLDRVIGSGYQLDKEETGMFLAVDRKALII